MTFSPPCQPPPYCPRAVAVDRSSGSPDGGQHLLLLGAQVLRVHGDRLLHGGQRQKLQEVVLDDVACRADAVVVARAAADADVLGHRDLHVVDVVGVPDRLVQLVGEAQREDVLHRLLAEVVVDAEDRVGREGDLERGVQLTRRLQIAAERLLDDDATPRVGVVGPVVDKSGVLQLLRDDGEVARRDREVERVVAHGAAFDVELLDRLAQPAERVVVAELAGDEADALQQLLPRLLTERRARVLADGVVDDVREVLVLPVAAREADQREPGWQQTPVREVVHGGHELLAGQVARHAEDHERAGTGDAVQAPILGIAQRIVAARDFGSHRGELL